MPHSGQLTQFLRQIPYLSWVIVLCAFSWGVFGTMLGAVTPQLRQDLHLGYADMGVLMAIWPLGSAIGSIMGGQIAQRFAPRRLLLSYAILAVLLLLCIVLAQHFWQLVLGFFCIAITETALFTVGHGLLAALSTDPERRTRIISLVDVGYSLGTLCAPLWVMAVYLFVPSWRWPYAAFLLLLLGLTAALWPRRAYEGAQAAAWADSASAAPHSPAAGRTEGYAALLRQPLVRWLWAAGFFVGFAEVGAYFWYVSYAIEAWSLSERQAHLGLACFTLGMVGGRLWQAFWESRWRMGQKIRYLGLLGLLSVSLLGLSAFLPFSAFTPGSTAVMLWHGLCNLGLGLGIAVAFPVLLGRAIHAFAHEASRLSALLMLSITVGSQCAGLGIGLASKHIGIHAAYLSLALAMALFVLCTWRVQWEGE